MNSGKSRGVQVLEIDTGTMRCVILPTRGMSVWKIFVGDTTIGWDSPVGGPVHPCHVNLADPSGLGWLDGFDELVVRCGLESNGAPEFSEVGQLKYPLHGKIGNIPASNLSIESNADEGSLKVRGTVNESRFLIRSTEIDVEYTFHVGKCLLECRDLVKNRSAQPVSIQLLYHINIGAPLLEAGSRAIIPHHEIAPRDQRAAEGIGHWDTYLGPTVGYAEQVYFFKPKNVTDSWSSSVLVNSKQDLGVAVDFDTTTLPYFSLWKNTAASEDGYVTGLEPATGFPNVRSFEESKGRLVMLRAGEARLYRWNLDFLSTAEAVQSRLAPIEMANSIAPATPTFHSKPHTDWSSQ